jgi:hypothetical protein
MSAFNSADIDTNSAAEFATDNYSNKLSINSAVQSTNR